MSISLPPGLKLEVSRDAGKTWHALRPGYQQGGNIEWIENGTIMVQSVGRGQAIWYREVAPVSGDEIINH